MTSNDPKVIWRASEITHKPVSKSLSMANVTIIVSPLRRTVPMAHSIAYADSLLRLAAKKYVRTRFSSLKAAKSPLKIVLTA